jgi:predicted site-specific integrase-resolvase
LTMLSRQWRGMFLSYILLGRVSSGDQREDFEENLQAYSAAL